MSQDEVSLLREEIARLGGRVVDLERILREQGFAVQGPHSVGIPFTVPQPKPAPTAPPLSQPVVASVPQQTSEPSIPAKPGKHFDLEIEIGGHWLSIVAAVCIGLGMAFFLKYAIENRWINETARIIIGIIVGMGFVGAGEFFQAKKLPRFAQSVSGTGIAILYFSIYAAFAFYSLIPQLPAFLFMVVVTTAAIALSVRHESRTIAVLGIIGGFLTPALMNRGATGGGGGDSQIQLFTYIAVLNLGILGITYYKNWRVLNLLSLLGTMLVFAGWMADSYNPHKLAVTMTFLTIFYLIFAAQSFVQNVVARRSMNAADIVLAVGAPALYFTTSFYLLSGRFSPYLGLFAVVMGAVYLLLSQRVSVSDYNDQKLRILFLVVAAAFLIIAVPIQLKQRWITIGWTAEAALIVWLGFYFESVKTRIVGNCLLGVVVFRLLTIETILPYGNVAVPFANARFTVFAVSVAVIWLVAWMYSRYREAITDDERKMQTMLVIGANCLLMWILSFESLDAAGLGVDSGYGTLNLKSMILTCVWSLYAVLLFVVGFMASYRPVRIMSIVVFGVVIAKSFLYDVWELDKLFRIIAFVGLGAVLLVVSYFYQAQRKRISGAAEGEDGRDEA